VKKAKISSAPKLKTDAVFPPAIVNANTQIRVVVDIEIFTDPPSAFEGKVMTELSLPSNLKVKEAKSITLTLLEPRQRVQLALEFIAPPGIIGMHVRTEIQTLNGVSIVIAPPKFGNSTGVEK
jgi:hypothetical protein